MHLLDIDVENIILEDLVKNYKGVNSITFTYITSNNVLSGYSYSFYVNDENHKNSDDYLWEYSISDDKEIEGMAYPRSGNFVFHDFKDGSKNIIKEENPKSMRTTPLKKVDIRKIKIKYKLSED
ncbi:hypothetical protein [Companilactobacillus metriopterae]|uniref:hypothetical protein n=1 Tax=Companilactobacillus metriopterae TaxID=1909267 RepID=UPI00100B0523|nr:hypothetical protein [Companilactobacillus metriopterae]